MYSPPIGFRIALEGILGSKNKNTIFSVQVSVIPPGAPYNPLQYSEVASFQKTEIDFESTINFHCFADDQEEVLRNIKLTATSVLLFDVKQYSLETKSYSDYGFAMYPLTENF